MPTHGAWSVQVRRFGRAIIGAVGLWLPVPYYDSTVSAACDDIVKLVRAATALVK
jgi:hypothetical protein